MANNDEIIVLSADGTRKTEQTAHDQRASELADQLGDIGGYATVHIYRCNPGSKNADQFCDQLPADKYDAAGLMLHIKETFGAGDYRLLMYKQGERGVRQNKLISIARPVVNATVVTTPELKGEIGTVIAGLAQMMQQQQAQMLAFMESQKRTVDPYADMDRNLGMLAKMREAFGAPAQAPVAPDPIETLTKTVTGLVSVITAVKTVGGDLGGLLGNAAPEDDSLVGLAKVLAPQLLSVVSNQQKIHAAESARDTALKVAAIRRRNPASPRPAPAKPPAAPALGELMPRQAFDLLQQAAVADSDPDDIAEQAASFLTPDLKKVITGEKPFKVLVRHYPVVLDYAEWWFDLIAALQDKLGGDTVGQTPLTGTKDDSASTVP